MTTNGVNNLEDAEMAECDGEKVVTMMDVLQEEQDFEDDANAVLGASDEKNCTYSKGYIKRQAVYACLTCCTEAKDDPTKQAGVCLACSLNCHENHELVELYTKRNFRCDCGNPNFNSHPCQFTPNKDNLNEDNNYNQNFSGLYCTCHKPYPDPESTLDDEEMIQCIICEDWLHTSHLDAAVPGNDQYSEMTCKACMDKNEFLHDYSHLAVNIEIQDVDVEGVNGLDSSLTNGNLSTDNVTNNTDNPSDGTTEKYDENMDKDKAHNEDTLSTANGENLENTSQVPIEENSEKQSDITMPPEDVEGTAQKSNDNIESKIEESSEKPPEETPEPSENTQEGSVTITEDNSKEEANDTTENMANTTSEATENVTSEDTMKEISQITNVTSENLQENAEELKENNETEEDKKDVDKDEQKMDSEELENTLDTDEQKMESEEPEKAVEKDEQKTESEEPEKNVQQSENNDVEADIPSEKDKDESSKIDSNDADTKDEERNSTLNGVEANTNSADSNIDSSNSGNSESVTDKINITEAEQTTNDMATEEVSKESEANELNDKAPEMNIEEPKLTKTEETKETKRKLSIEETDIDDHLVKKPKLTCIRPKGIKRVHKGALFWPSNFRQKLCTCSDCLSMYRDLSVLFLVDPEDTVIAYETLGKERVNARATQYEKGLEALSSLDRIQQINALTEYNKMKDKLLDFLKSFKDRQEVVKEDDIKAFFAGMKAKREPDGVYFCR